MQFGRYYEEFEVGATYRHWPGKTITEADDHLFCLITMNRHPLHLDAHYAETSTHFKRNVVVGNLVYSLALGMSVRTSAARRSPTSRWRTSSTRTPPSTATPSTRRPRWWRCAKSASRSDRGVVTVETRAYNQRNELVCFFRRRVMVPKRSAGLVQPPDEPIVPAGGKPDLER